MSASPPSPPSIDGYKLPPDHEISFRFFRHHKPAAFVACCWWCVELEVWDVIVYHIDTQFDEEVCEFVCGGVSLKRFERVIGQCDQALAKKLSAATAGLDAIRYSKDLK